MLFEIIVQLCWHASLVQELILLFIRLLEQSTYIFFTKKKGCVFDERNFKNLFFDKEGAISFFSYQRLLGAYFAVIQKMSREQLLQACGRYFDDNWEATGTGRSWAAGMSSEKKIASDIKNWKQFWRNLQQFSRT